MNISSINNISFNGKLIPKSEYKGVILKLTPADKKKIAEYQKKISDYTLEDMKLLDLLKKCKNEEKLIEYYTEKSDQIEFYIDQLKDAIAEIKAERMKKQLAKAKKLDKII